MTTMILVRHAQPEVDPGVAAVDWTLSASGRSQATMLAARIRPLMPDAIFTSPERKARETAEILGAALQLAVRVVPEFREHDRQGVPYLHAPGEFEECIRRVFAFPQQCGFGNESGEAALARFRCGVRQVVQLGARRPVVVSHGTVLSLYIAAELGIDAFGVWQRMRTPSYVLLG